MNMVFFISLGCLGCRVRWFRGCVGCCAFCLSIAACSLRCVFTGSIFVSSCRWLVLVSRVHPVIILFAVLSTDCSLFMFVCDIMGDVMVFAYSSLGLTIALYVMVRVSLDFPMLCP